MIRSVLLVIFVISFTFCSSKSVNRKREPRWFGYSYTTTIVKPKMITSLVPSSCVYVEPSLPPCRSVRNLRNFPQIFTGNFLFDHKDEISEEFIKGNNSFYVDSSIGTTALGWGEYFGLIAPTVTATAFHLETMTLMDPNTIVTFSIKGCRPSRLPMDLGTCQNVPGLKPSPTTPEIMTSTVFKPDILPPSYVYGSESEMMATESYEATENLE